MKKVTTYYWSQGQFVKNFGDCLIDVILRGMGYQCIHGLSELTSVNPNRLLFGIGTILSDEHIAMTSTITIDVWGSGWGGGVISDKSRAKLRFFAVRGPITAKAFSLSHDFPMGDPGLLLPILYQNYFDHQGEVILIPHYTQYRRLVTNGFRDFGCDRIISTYVFLKNSYIDWQNIRTYVRDTRRFFEGYPVSEFWDFVKSIASAKFVLTGSLHGAILAQAYGIPWAPFSDGYIDHPTKWHDWGGYLGIDIEFCHDLTSAQKWWHHVGSKGKVPNLDQLIESFPYVSTKSSL